MQNPSLFRARGIAASILVLCLGAAVHAVGQGPEAPPPGGPGGPGGPARAGFDASTMMYSEIAWAGMRFECGVDAAKIDALRPAFREEWKQLRDARAKARESRDFAAMTDAATAAKEKIDTALAKHLTETEVQCLSAWRKKATEVVLPTGGDRRGMRARGDIFYPERAWTILAFETGLDPAAVEKLAPAFAEAWAARAKATGEDRAQAAEAARNAIEAALEEGLTAEQWTAFQAAVSPRGPRDRDRGTRSPGDGPRPEGRGPGGAAPPQPRAQ